RTGIPQSSILELYNHIAANIKTNISEHFFKRQLHYICARDNLSTKEGKEKQKRINQPGKTNDDSLPANIETSVEYDLKKYPERFLLPMWRMNTLFAKK